MKFAIEKENLVKVLSNVCGSIGKKNITIPILLNTKLEVKNNKLSVTTTDLDVVITSSINVDSENNGSTTVPAQLFFDIAKKIPEGSQIMIELAKDEKNLVIKYNKSKFKLPCLDPNDFPVIEQSGAYETFNISSQDLLHIVDKTRFAISNDEARYYLNGIYLHLKEEGKNKKIRGVATDGHRLAYAEAKAPNKLSQLTGVIIPKKTVNEIRKIIENVDEQLDFSLSKAKLKLVTSNTVIISKLIDGEFPEYEKVIPTLNDKEIKINKKVLFDAVDRVATIATDKHKAIRLLISKNTLTLQADTTDGGFGNEELKICYTAENIETGFNSRYMLDVLSQINEENVILKFKDDISPVILIGEKTDDALYVLMPVRI